MDSWGWRGRRAPSLCEGGREGVREERMHEERKGGEVADEKKGRKGEGGREGEMGGRQTGVREEGREGGRDGRRVVKEGGREARRKKGNKQNPYLYVASLFLTKE